MQRVSTHAVIKAASTDPDCTTLQVGTSLCLPEPCTLYPVQHDDTCTSILATIGNGLRATDLLTWNPRINPLCSNLASMAESLICVSPSGRALSDVTTITTPPTPTPAPPTAVPRPENAKAESHAQCAGWYPVQPGDYCQAISIRQGISLRDFYFLNPSVDNPTCLNLWLATSYCVKAVGDIHTYSGYPYSTTSPLYTLTSSAYVTTTLGDVGTVAPVATPLVELPLASGSVNAAGGCLEFVQHRVVEPQRGQDVQVDVPGLTEGVNSCDYVSVAFGVELADFLGWNPSLKGREPCRLGVGFRYCAKRSAQASPPTERACVNVTQPYPGTVGSCSCFTTIRGYEAGKYLCEDIASDKNITLANLVAWNPWIGSVSSCDTGLYSGLSGSAKRPVCVGVGGGGVTPTPTRSNTPTPTPTGVNPGGPTQPGIVAGCRKYYVAVSGDGCWAIANSQGIALDDFYAWNPALGTDCAGLWSGYAYCVQVPAPSGTPTPTPSPTSPGGVPPPGPTQPGTIASCKRWHTIVSGDGCWALQQTYNIPNFATLPSWNPSIGSNCEFLWLGYSVCVGV